MLTIDDAYSLVEEEFSKFDPSVDPVIVRGATKEFSWGWVVFYQSRKYLETNEVRHASAGNAPYLVNKHTGEIATTGTARPIGEYVREYESKIGAR
jgi:Immunity protein 35